MTKTRKRREHERNKKGKQGKIYETGTKRKGK